MFAVPVAVAVVAAAVVRDLSGSDSAAGAVFGGVLGAVFIAILIGLERTWDGVLVSKLFFVGLALCLASGSVSLGDGPDWIVWLLFLPGAAIAIVGFKRSHIPTVR